MKKVLAICCFLVGSFAWGSAPLEVKEGFNYYLVASPELQSTLDGIEGVNFFNLLPVNEEDQGMQIMEAPQASGRVSQSLTCTLAGYHAYAYDASNPRHATATDLLATPYFQNVKNHLGQFYIFSKRPPRINIVILDLGNGTSAGCGVQ